MKNKCTFKPGDKVFDTYDGSIADVTEITDRGFRYQYDKVKCHIPRWGMYFTGGECYCDLEWFPITWEIYTGKNKIKPLQTHYSNFY